MLFESEKRLNERSCLLLFLFFIWLPCISSGNSFKIILLYFILLILVWLFYVLSFLLRISIFLALLMLFKPEKRLYERSCLLLFLFLSFCIILYSRLCLVWWRLILCFFNGLWRLLVLSILMLTFKLFLIAEHALDKQGCLVLIFLLLLRWWILDWLVRIWPWRSFYLLLHLFISVYSLDINCYVLLLFIFFALLLVRVRLLCETSWIVALFVLWLWVFLFVDFIGFLSGIYLFIFLRLITLLHLLESENTLNKESCLIQFFIFFFLLRLLLVNGGSCSIILLRFLAEIFVRLLLNILFLLVFIFRLLIIYSILVWRLLFTCLIKLFIFLVLLILLTCRLFLLIIWFSLIFVFLLLFKSEYILYE